MTFPKNRETFVFKKNGGTVKGHGIKAHFIEEAGEITIGIARFVLKPGDWILNHGKKGLNVVSSGSFDRYYVSHDEFWKKFYEAKKAELIKPEPPPAPPLVANDEKRNFAPAPSASTHRKKKMGIEERINWILK